MSKNYQKAARGWLYALAAVIAGTCFSATPAQSATCFLPSGECSTGKIGAGPSGGESTPEYCVGYDITEKEYNAKYNNACWDCSDSCVKTSGGTFYKCKTVNNTTWYDKYNVCCTDGTKYDKDDGKCCAGGKCDHPCSGGKQWSPTLKQCVCPSNLETDGNGNCCASGQVLDENKNCTTPCTMNDCGSYPYTTDPGNSEACDLGCNKGTRYKCKSGYTYSGGKCVEQCKADGYTLTSAKDKNCYSCSTCPYDSSKYKCTENVSSNYQLVDGVCSPKPTECIYTYFEATTSNTCGTTGNLDNNYQCQRSTCCYQNLSKVESIDMRGGTGSVMPIFNKISNTSASCEKNGTTYYETLCTGTAKDLCSSSKIFTPNGCVSNAYNNGFEVKGTQWGTCGCDTSQNKYDTSDACKTATGKGCTSVSGCYQTCESQGYYSTEDACKQNLPSGYTCLAPGTSGGNSNCYTRDEPDIFTIKYQSSLKRRYTCDLYSYHGYWEGWIYLENTDGSYVKDVNGNEYSHVTDNDVQYPTGTYYVCSSMSGGQRGITRTSVWDPVGSSMCFGDNQPSGCYKTSRYGYDTSCHEFTFKKGRSYFATFSTENAHGYTCY